MGKQRENKNTANSTLGNALRIMRKHYHLTTDEVGEMIDVSGAAISTWERDFYIPITENLESILALYLNLGNSTNANQDLPVWEVAQWGITDDEKTKLLTAVADVKQIIPFLNRSDLGGMPTKALSSAMRDLEDLIKKL